MPSKTEKMVIDFISPIVDGLGYELADVEYAKKNTGMNLTVFLAKKDLSPITINDCEIVHRAIDAPLDELDPTNGASYTLNVSSLSLDRPFKYERDYERYLDKEIVVKLYAVYEGKKEFVGILKQFDADKITLQLDNQTLDIPRQKIAVCQPYIKF